MQKDESVNKTCQTPRSLPGRKGISATLICNFLRPAVFWLFWL